MPLLEDLNQHQLEENRLILNVRKSPLIIRIILYIITFISFFAPISSILISIASGGGLKAGYFFAFLFWGLIGYFMLKRSLWNTLGKEIIVFYKDKITYEANYGWFKDGTKEIKNRSIEFYYEKAGFEEDNEGVLIIQNNEDKIKTVAKISISELNQLINSLNSNLTIEY